MSSDPTSLETITQLVANADPEVLRSAVLEALGSKRIDRWEAMLPSVMNSVVSIHFGVAFSTDTDMSCCSEATGFVVDAERGIILTNRHVVTSGPFYGYAVFQDHEEVPVHALFRDPVHDFGFLKFDTSKRRGTLSALKLTPEHASVGREIRLIGNDAGQKLSILSGTISRVDRNAPDYGTWEYNDFNTAYIQAAAAASGGSSGSPVVDLSGNAVAMQAGGTEEASTDFFIPLHRAKRALSLIQQGSPVLRGTILVQWSLRPYDECRRLGLSLEEEERARTHNPEGVGLLVAIKIIPGGPADGSISEGDVLVGINGKRVTDFLMFDDILDTSIGQTLKIDIQRAQKTQTVQVCVKDLNNYTPNQVVKAGSTWFTCMSYQMARQPAIPIKGLMQLGRGDFVFEGGYAPLIAEVDGKPVNTAEEFAKAYARSKNHDYVRVKVMSKQLPTTPIVTLGLMNKDFYPETILGERNDETGLFEFRTIEAEPLTTAPKEKPKRVPKYPTIEETDSERVKVSKKFARSVVQAEVLAPMWCEGESSYCKTANALVLSVEKGLLIASTVVATHKLVSVWVTIGGSVIRKGKISFIHPQHGYFIIECDLSGIEGIEALKLSNTLLDTNDSLFYVVPDSQAASEVTMAGRIPVVRQECWGLPSYRVSDIDTVTFVENLTPDGATGAIIDRKTGEVKALRLGSACQTDNGAGRGGSHPLVIDSPKLWLKENRPRHVDCIASDLLPSMARLDNVPEEWCQKFEGSSESRSFMFQLDRIPPNYAGTLEEGDIILELDGKLFTEASQLTGLEAETVKITVARNGEVFTYEIPTSDGSEYEISTIVEFCGMLIHNTYRAMMQTLSTVPPGVVTIDADLGSPSVLYEIPEGAFITHVNGVPTPNTDIFWEEIQKIKTDTYVRLRLVDRRGAPSAKSVRTNYWYYPNWRRQLQPDGSWALEKGDWPSGFSVR